MIEESTLVYGAGQNDRVVNEPKRKLEKFIREDGGYGYLKYHPITPQDHLYPEDIGITLLFNSNARNIAVQSLIDHGKSINLSVLPSKNFKNTTKEDRNRCAEIIHSLTKWDGFSTSLATKTLHKKLPNLIPVLDNRAIFGAYMNPYWPKFPSRGDSIYDFNKIREALNWIYYDLNRDENKSIWPVLAQVDPDRTFIEIFDMVWWIHYREIETV